MNPFNPATTTMLPATTTMWPTTTGTYVSSAGAATWTTTNTNTNTPYATEHLTVTGDVVCRDIQLANASLTTMLQHVAFLMPPAGLNLDNVAVADVYAKWINAIDEVRQAHLALATVVALTQTNE